MMAAPEVKVNATVVDYGLGNLFNIGRACEYVGMDVVISSQKEDILKADVVILPGVGAFGDAMATLRRLDLVNVLRDIAEAGKPLVGICLGTQLLMSESCEFGLHRGLGIIEGSVLRFECPSEGDRILKVPQVQWNQIFRSDCVTAGNDVWIDTPLGGLGEGEFLYFVHSFYVRPTDPSVVLSTSRYGHIEFCSSLQRRNVFACQFHPERSGPAGLQIYRNLVRAALGTKGVGTCE